MSRLYVEKEESFRVELSALDYQLCGIASDMWTGVNQTLYISATISFKTLSLEMHSRDLDVKSTTATHTAEMICQHLSEVLSEWCLDSTELYVTKDNGANVVKAV